MGLAPTRPAPGATFTVAAMLVGFSASLCPLVETRFRFDGLDGVIEYAYRRTQRWSEHVGLAGAAARARSPS